LKILVTGGAGYVGGTVAEDLLQAGHSVVIYDNLCHGHRSTLPPAAAFVEGDLADRNLLQTTLSSGEFDGVMHFAALIEAGESMQKPEIYFRNNSASTLTLLESMLATGVKRLVFSSTAALYGEPEFTPIPEDAPLRPTNAYGESKLLVEQMLRWFYQIHGFSYASLRYFNVAGAVPGRGEAHEPESHLIPLILDVALGRRESIKIFGQDYPTVDGTAVRDYIHVRDLSRAHLMAFTALAGKPEPQRLIYNIGNGVGFTVRQIVDAVGRVTGKPIKVIVEPRRAGDPAVLIASSEKITAELGWHAEYAEIDSIIESAWEWHKERYQRTGF
jgi:UDP-glucose 4-epimerase